MMIEVQLNGMLSHKLIKIRNHKNTTLMAYLLVVYQKLFKLSNQAVYIYIYIHIYIYIYISAAKNFRPFIFFLSCPTEFAPCLISIRSHADKRFVFLLRVTSQIFIISLWHLPWLLYGLLQMYKLQCVATSYTAMLLKIEKN